VGKKLTTKKGEKKRDSRLRETDPTKTRTRKLFKRGELLLGLGNVNSRRSGQECKRETVGKHDGVKIMGGIKGAQGREGFANKPL